MLCKISIKIYDLSQFLVMFVRSAFAYLLGSRTALCFCYCCLRRGVKCILCFIYAFIYNELWLLLCEVLILHKGEL